MRTITIPLRTTVLCVAIACSAGWALTPGVGLRGGAIVSDIWGPLPEKTVTPLFGPVVGLTIPMEVTPLVSVDPELLVTRKGFGWDSVLQITFNGSTWDTAYQNKWLSLWYVEIPVMVRFTAPNSQPLNVYGAIGPVIDIVMNAKQHRKSSATSAEAFEDLGSLVNTIDAGLSVAVGSNINLGKRGVVNIEIHYGAGFVGIYKGSSTRNWVAGLSLGYVIKLIKDTKVKDTGKVKAGTKLTPDTPPTSPDEEWQ